MKSPRFVIALASTILLSSAFAGPVFAKGNSVSHEPSRFFEGVPRSAAPERSFGRSTEQEPRAPRKGCCCTGLFEILCN
jgi:hypothetical protein